MLKKFIPVCILYLILTVQGCSKHNMIEINSSDGNIRLL